MAPLALNGLGPNMLPIGYRLRIEYSAIYFTSFLFQTSANTEESAIHEVFYSHVLASPWGQLLNKIVPVEASQQFMEVYLMDFVCMMYTARKNAELEVGFSVF